MVSSLRPYMIRAIYEWVVDNNLTPMLGVRNENAAAEAGVQREPYVFYNIGPQAVRDLVIDEDGVRFHARISGQLVFVQADLQQIISMFCKESQTGARFVTHSDKDVDLRELPRNAIMVTEPQVLEPEVAPDSKKDSKPRAKAKRSHLRVVRPNED